MTEMICFHFDLSASAFFCSPFFGSQHFLAVILHYVSLDHEVCGAWDVGRSPLSHPSLWLAPSTRAVLSLIGDWPAFIYPRGKHVWDLMKTRSNA